LQLFEILENGGALPLGRFQRLPSTIVMNRGSISTLLQDLPARQADRNKGDVELPALPGKNEGKWKYEIKSFRFLPDGSTDLKPTGKWFVTIHGQEAKEEASEPPSNFFTIQVDPINGATRSYRPTAG
jgi:hypothetical protein